MSVLWLYCSGSCLHSICTTEHYYRMDNKCGRCGCVLTKVPPYARVRAVRMAKIGCVITPANANWEYRCGKCGQLRFYPGANRPINCGNCRSTILEVGRPGTLPIPQDVVGGAPLYAAGFKNPDGMGMFGGPTTDLQSLLNVCPPEYNPQNSRAYIVRIDLKDVTPVARWHNDRWQRKETK